jgi:hypothetical protein
MYRILLDKDGHMFTHMCTPNLQGRMGNVFFNCEDIKTATSSERENSLRGGLLIICATLTLGFVIALHYFFLFHSFQFNFS